MHFLQCRHDQLLQALDGYTVMDLVLHAATLAVLTSALALGLSDYDLSFHLYVQETNSFILGILVHKDGSYYCPMAFYSSKMPPVIQGMPVCWQAVAPMAILIGKSASIVMGSSCQLFATSKLTSVLKQFCS